MFQLEIPNKENQGKNQENDNSQILSNASNVSSPGKNNIRIRSINGHKKNGGQSFYDKDKFLEFSKQKPKIDNYFTPIISPDKKNQTSFNFSQTPKTCLKKNSQFAHHESVFKPNTERIKLINTMNISPKAKIVFKKEQIPEEMKEDKKISPLNKKDIYLLQKNIRYLKETNGNLSNLAMRETLSNRFYKNYIGFLAFILKVPLKKNHQIM